MDPKEFAAAGMAVIGLIAGVVGSAGGVWAARPGNERRYVLLWSAAFTLTLVTFMVGVCLLPPSYRWLLVVPFVGIPLTVNAANRAPGKFRGETQLDNGLT